MASLWNKMRHLLLGAGSPSLDDPHCGTVLYNRSTGCYYVLAAGGLTAICRNTIPGHTPEMEWSCVFTCYGGIDVYHTCATLGEAFDWALTYDP